jgi:hypothetical protein
MVKMNTLKEKAPVLWTIFFKKDAAKVDIPYGCYDCVFATKHNDWGNNPYPEDDREYYDCRLLNQKGIWGGDPQCNNGNWIDKGTKEIEAIANFNIQKEIVEEKATILLNRFCEALEDENNGDLTLRQIREKLFVGIEPNVIARFEAKLRPMGN